MVCRGRGRPDPAACAGDFEPFAGVLRRRALNEFVRVLHGADDVAARSSRSARRPTEIVPTLTLISSLADEIEATFMLISSAAAAMVLMLAVICSVLPATFEAWIDISSLWASSPCETCERSVADEPIWSDSLWISNTMRANDFGGVVHGCRQLADLVALVQVQPLRAGRRRRSPWRARRP